MSNDRLFGQPDDEWLHHDLETAAEAALDALADPTATVTIREWTTSGPLDWMPSPEAIVEWVIETACDDAVSINDGSVVPSPRNPRLVAAAEALRQAISSQFRWKQAEKKVRDWVFAPEVSGRGTVAWRCEDADLTITFPTREAT